MREEQCNESDFRLDQCSVRDGSGQPLEPEGDTWVEQRWPLVRVSLEQLETAVVQESRVGLGQPLVTVVGGGDDGDEHKEAVALEEVGVDHWRQRLRPQRQQQLPSDTETLQGDADADGWVVDGRDLQVAVDPEGDDDELHHRKKAAVWVGSTQPNNLKHLMEVRAHLQSELRKVD